MLQLIIILLILLSILILTLYCLKVRKELASMSINPVGCGQTVAIGDDVTTHECMEWTDGERIAVFRTGGLIREKRILTVLSHTNEGHRSTVEVSGDFSMGGNRSHTYFGVYPARAFNTYRGTVLLSGEIPELQMLSQDCDTPRFFKADMGKHGYMYAISPGNSRESGNNELRFLPLVNTYVFKIHSPAENYMDSKLVSLMLSSEQDDAPLSGTFHAKLDPNTGSHAPLQKQDVEGGKRLVVAYFKEGIMLGKTPEEDTAFQLVSTPMDHTKLKLSLRFQNGSIRSLSFKKNDGWISVKACRKTVFSNLAVPGKIKDATEPENEAIGAGNKENSQVLFT